MTLAAGVSLHWDGLHGWLIFLACACFLLAALASAGKLGRWSGLAILLIALGLLLWAVTGIISG